MFSSFILVSAIALYLALILVWGGADYLGFGFIYTRQRWGHPRQYKPWESYTTFEKALYRIVQHLFIVGTIIGVYLSFGVAGQIAAFASVLAYPFMPHDLTYHLVGGHMHPAADYNPLSMDEKVKKYSLHYWPLRWIVKIIPSLREDYPVGIPYRWETLGRIFGFLLGLTVVTLLSLA